MNLNYNPCKIKFSSSSFFLSLSPFRVVVFLVSAGQLFQDFNAIFAHGRGLDVKSLQIKPSV